MDAGKEAPVVRFGLDVGAVPVFIAPHAFGHGQVVDSTRHRAVDSLTKQSQISRSNVSHLVVDVLLQDCG